MPSLRPTQHIERVPALRHMTAKPHRPFSFGTALIVAVISTFLVSFGVARLVTAIAR